MRSLPLRALLLLPLVLALAACGRQPSASRLTASVSPASALVSGVTFRVAVPAATPAGDTVFVAGDFQGWNAGSPAHALAKQPDGRWTITLPLAAGTPVQFKFTRGSWAKVEKGASGEEIANRTLTPVDGTTYDFTVQRWADLGTITGNVTSFALPAFGGRTIRVYLPPGYASSSQRYPVLYMHDGQNLFDVRTSFAGEWKVDETCEQLIGSGEVAPIIVVGIDNTANRITEYTPWPDPGYGGGGAEAYLQSVITVLKPEIDARYRTLTGPNWTWMAGSSLGGLVSVYAGLAHWDVFGRVAALSPSYWWDNRQMAAWAAAQPRAGLQRIYQDMGTAEGSAQYVTDLRTMRDLLVAKGFVENVDLESVEAAGATHSETYWALRFPDVLRFLVGAPTTAGVP